MVKECDYKKLGISETCSNLIKTHKVDLNEIDKCPMNNLMNNCKINSSHNHNLCKFCGRVFEDARKQVLLKNQKINHRKRM